MPACLATDRPVRASSWGTCCIPPPCIRGELLCWDACLGTCVMGACLGLRSASGAALRAEKPCNRVSPCETPTTGSTLSRRGCAEGMLSGCTRGELVGHLWCTRGMPRVYRGCAGCPRPSGFFVALARAVGSCAWTPCKRENPTPAASLTVLLRVQPGYAQGALGAQPRYSHRYRVQPLSAQHAGYSQGTARVQPLLLLLGVLVQGTTTQGTRV